MSKGKFSLDIQWSSGKTCIDGEISDDQYGAICRILSPDFDHSVEINKMVSRFLSWPLPDSVCVDGCAKIPGYPLRHGTNLLTADEAKAMLEYLLKGDTK